MNINQTLGDIRQLTQQEQGAIVVLVSSYGPYNSSLYESIKNAYLAGDAATVTQVQYYMGSNTGSIGSIFTQSYFGLPLWGWLVGGFIAYKLKKV
jgi:hypothetical protein